MVNTIPGNLDMIDPMGAGAKADKSNNNKKHHQTNKSYANQSDKSKTSTQQQQAQSQAQASSTSQQPMMGSGGGDYPSNSELNAFELENNASGVGCETGSVAPGTSAVAVANISSTSQLNIALNNNNNNNRFEDDDENSFLPNDIVEFNSLDELVDYFNSNNNNNNNQERPSIGDVTSTFSEALRFNSFAQYPLATTFNSNSAANAASFNWLISAGANSGHNHHHHHHHHHRSDPTVRPGDNVNSLGASNIIENSMTTTSEEKYLQGLGLMGSEMRGGSVGQSKSDPDSNK